MGWRVGRRSEGEGSCPLEGREEHPREGEGSRPKE